MNSNPVKDETLRLLYSEQETRFITDKIKYNRRSLLLCLWGVTGMPVFYFANWAFMGSGMFFLLLGSFLWAILGVFSSLWLIPIILNLKKYNHMKKEHREFLKKYNRLSAR